MTGLEAARGYFEEFGLPMLKEKFPHLLPRLAAGLTGSGSECFGYDDEWSRDHDFEPGFCLFLPGEEIISRQEAFRLERAYAALPAEYAGLRRGLAAPAGGPRRGVMRTADFFLQKTGTPDGEMSLTRWLTVPDHALAEAVNGEIFMDGPGEVTRIRNRLARFPEDVRRKKLAGHLLMMAQAGPYNYARCLRHGETGAAQLAAGEFVRAAMRTVFLLNDVYEPYYKWSFRAMRGLERLSLLAELLEYLLTTDNSPALRGEKQEVMEGICGDVVAELRRQGLSSAASDDPEAHAYAVHAGIRDGELRNLHILAAV